MARLAAGALDPMALASTPEQTSHRSAPGAGDRLLAGLRCRRRIRSCPDDRPPGVRRVGGVRLADPAARNDGGDRLVLGVLLHDRSIGDLGGLRRDDHRRPGPDRRQRRQARARLQPRPGAGHDLRQERPAAGRGAARRAADLRNQRHRVRGYLRAADLCRQRHGDGQVHRQDQADHGARHGLRRGARGRRLGRDGNRP